MIIWNKKKIPALYLFIYKLMKEKAESSLYISYPRIRELFNRRLYRIPKKYHNILLKEMQELGLIKKVGNKNCIKYQFLAKNAEKLLNKYVDIF